MAGSIIIDRRKNPQGKSLNNRQRFIERAKKSIQDAARRKIAGRSINDTGDADISIPTDGIDEPNFHHDRDFGEYDYVMPGNEDFVPGDEISKPPKEGGARGNRAGRGESEDDFEFALSYEEYLNVIFEGLELPDMIKENEKNVVKYEMVRAGHTNVGIPSNLNVERTAIAGIGRRMALKAPKIKKIKELEQERELVNSQINALERSWYKGDPAEFEVGVELDLSKVDEEAMDEREALMQRLAEIDAEISRLRISAAAVGFLDDVDLRYNNFTKQARPSTQAVMFCIMDVSGSMGEREKTIAKKFFLLLSLFLRRRYKNIDVVFIRHHESAKECDEDTFFRSRESGGTVVSTAYELMNSVLKERYPVNEWNIYLAQVSDGDNMEYDNLVVTQLLDDLLPQVQHFNYIEVPHAYRSHMFWGTLQYDEGLWSALKTLKTRHKNMEMAQIDDDQKVIEVFRALFSKDKR